MSMNYDGDAFISYAHLDNVELTEGHKGWVANLHRALEIRVAQLLGKPSSIWWDPKLQGNDYFADTLTERLQHVAALVSVVSPRYVKSEWGRRELVEFCKAAGQQGGLRVRDKARIFKVVKTPVPLELHPPELQSLLGYEFFKVDPDTGKVRELDEIFGPEAERDFWIKLDDLAHDVCCLLEMLAEPEQPAAAAAATGKAPGEPVFLAVTTADLKERGFWDDYQKAFEDALQHTSTGWAPWYVIPADHKWVTRALVGGIVTSAIRGLRLRRPAISAEQKRLPAQANEFFERCRQAAGRRVRILGGDDLLTLGHPHARVARDQLLARARQLPVPWRTWALEYLIDRRLKFRGHFARAVVNP